MKNAINAYLTPTEGEIKKIWENAFFVFDTNILLEFYRYSEKTRSTLFEILEDITEDLWLPYQIAVELILNRESAVKEYLKSLKSVRSDVESHYRNLKNIFRSRDNDETTSKIIKNFDLIGTALTTLESEFGQLEKNLQVSSNTNDDEILHKLLEIYDGKVGLAPSKSEENDSVKEGEQRYKHDIPPGYKDKSKSTNKYGDYFIWKAVMKHAKEEKKDLIFISNDLKEDWWKEISGEKRGPRHELTLEFNKETNQNFLMYSLEGFLSLYSKNKNHLINEETQTEIRSFAKETNSTTSTKAIGGANHLNEISDVTVEQLFPDLKLYETVKNLVKIRSFAPEIDFSTLKQVQDAQKLAQQYFDN